MDQVASGDAASSLTDSWRTILDLGNSRIRITCPDGTRRTVSRIRARLIELTSLNCKRRIMFQDFIALVLQALEMTQGNRRS
ncbi:MULTISPECIES: hypothetical protein [unclassified Sphingobium]|uniref:hypothetical protein n=1 Tax=unclassified Sphingobium TaxID=2611147 RepID=UPI0022256071|nr:MULTISPECIES: hypothetical protein [unclassified Sphingobium]MCW2380623.1 hypothetical protein [Sphingobium sp. B2D3B]MCW2399270.1 hypothetical protein [Sphingobium sp. B2D3C]